jgi:hypothetical protein
MNDGVDLRRVEARNQPTRVRFCLSRWRDLPILPVLADLAQSVSLRSTSAALLHGGAYFVDLDLWITRPVRRLNVPPKLRVVHHAAEAVLA